MCSTTSASTPAGWPLASTRLAGNMASHLRATPAYSQLRFIGIADGGRELVRVDRDAHGGAVRRIPDRDLQRKGDRPYFQQALRLPAGAVSVSSIELNQEHGAIEVPHVPTVRLATPVHADGGQPFGIVILNVDLRPAFAELRDAADPRTLVFLANDRGDYLVHPDPGRAFGFELGRPSRWQDDLPPLADPPASGAPVARAITTPRGERLAAALASTRLAEGPRVTVIATLPGEAVTAAAAGVRHATVIAGLTTTALAAALAVMLARSLTSPLAQLTRAAERLGHGDPVTIPTTARGEVGVLARAFERMSLEARDKTAVVECSTSPSRSWCRHGSAPSTPTRVSPTWPGPRRARWAPGAISPVAARTAPSFRWSGLTPINTADASLVMASVMDLTQRRAAAQPLVAHTEELQRSNAELEHFAYVASHDLQEPLQMVASYTALLAERYRGRLDERADRYIHFAVDGAHRMQKLLNDLLAYSRVGTRGKPLQPTDAAAIVRAVLHSLRDATIEAGADVHCDPLPAVDADETQLGQVFQNLVASAVGTTFFFTMPATEAS